MTRPLDFGDQIRIVAPFRRQLLKWIGNKQRFADEIASFFPKHRTYFEPFLGSGAVLATLQPANAVASDTFGPLMQIWQALDATPNKLAGWYEERWEYAQSLDSPKDGYEKIKADYNQQPNGADLIYLCRACYGGVVRFRQRDGYMSTPCGVHAPVSPASFRERVRVWHERTRGATFKHCDYKEAFKAAKNGDLIYCDPPYLDSQTILYGAQSFTLAELFEEIQAAAKRGVMVVLSIDGTKRSGDKICNIGLPKGIFKTEALVNCGRSMLRRFQMGGQTLEKEVVQDRLLLTYE